MIFIAHNFPPAPGLIYAEEHHLAAAHALHRDERQLAGAGQAIWMRQQAVGAAFQSAHRSRPVQARQSRPDISVLLPGAGQAHGKMAYAIRRWFAPIGA